MKLICFIEFLCDILILMRDSAIGKVGAYGDDRGSESEEGIQDRKEEYRDDGQSKASDHAPI